MKNQQSDSLFKSFRMGDIELKNRIVMAPMTRGRGIHETHQPTELMETYYQQRAGAGLIISEGVIISEMANGYINIPGIYTDQQVEGWKKITRKIHNEGSKIFAQIWHVGRISHPDLLGGKLPLAPSAINPNFYAYTFDGQKDTVTPKEMTVQDIKTTVADFKKAAVNAVAAGFDGVEIHAANTYLIHQFITASANRRTDVYGGSTENRARFLFEVLDEVTAAIGGDKVGVRLSPDDHDIAGIMLDEDTGETYDYIITKLNDYQLAYVHLTGALMSPAEGQTPYQQIQATTKKYRNIYKGNIIINKGFDKQTGEQVIRDGIADLVAYGSSFIANPDLVERFRYDLPIASPDPDTFYQGGEKGYTDYPAIQSKTV